MGSSTREDEPWAYDCRENLRKLLVGKEITFTPTHSLPPSNTDPDVQRDFGNVDFNGDLAKDLLASGWARTKEGSKREPTEEDLRKKELENEAKQAGRGIWRPEGPPQRTVHNTMPADSQAFLKQWKDQMIDGIVEQVRDGSTLRVRLLLADDLHQIVTISLAGIRCPRTGGKDGEPGEPYGDEAKFFTESRLLQRLVRVKLLSVPTPAALPFSSTSGPPPPASMFIGIVMHPNGNIGEHLVASGLARVVDWHAGMLAAGGFMERLRAAESTAKEKKQFLYAQQEGGNAKGKAPGAASSRSSDQRNIDGQVIRVWSADQISILDKAGKERRVQLSSTRAPKTTDPKQAFYAAEGREFLRKKLIGKTVHAHVDFVRPQEGAFEERECATVRFGASHANIAEQLIAKGLATVVRHKRDDEDRSPDYDKLMAAEQTAINEKLGLHSGKEATVPKLVNASENVGRATQFLSGFKRQKRVPAVVDYVAAGSRFKLLIPRDNVTLTFVLSGIRAPKTARNESERSDPYGPEAAEFATRRYMQRDVEVEFEAVDKSGGFIGAMYLNKTENAAITLVKEGLATVHAHSAEGLSWSKQLMDAEEEAKKARKNIWKDHAEEEAPAPEAESSVPTKVEFIDVILSDIRTDEFGFSVQILNTEGIASLEKLMVDFAKHYQTAPPAPGFVPKAQELISAKFSDGQWYRAKVKRASPAKKEAEVVFIDYGNRATLPFTHTRPLERRFASLPPQAHDARLSFVKLVAPGSEYYDEATERFRALCEGRKLIGNIDYREGSILHLRLIDPSDPASGSGEASINADMVREGYASIERKGVVAKYNGNYPNVMKTLEEALRTAKRERAGMFEYGNVDDEED
ncbi:Staphylococcal nuclease domain-containing protein 1 AltName: Full=100 kDa coactivator; AltName: Full=EBNA2 coactivator p100; AltName: Full=Tudor domain-containing protein 11; AltName: Full=p100 co-activator [Serendipita indica DSM 11827]|nr:Staphylococcal nuclease domain-containing protein 1 AltName: Full=100 kDa coactivator; AltName: Full=EBNA2 coactivator p100; AltName: Full=Tudor domain-containing protein 11; AltName: Full=p100 co-activator [Serendipita indica DSM 11827]